MAVSAVIVAGGSGNRFGLKKQFLSLGGVPIIHRVVEAFSAHPSVKIIVVVVPAEDTELARRILSNLSPPVRFARGGTTRQESVFNGIREAGGSGLILIHDAARPFVTKELISRVIEGVGEATACIPALAVPGTLKEVLDGRVVRTVPRTNLFEAQTPQAFRTSAILDAHARALKRGITAATDDSLLIEDAGGEVRVVRGDPMNIKITVREDLAMAEAILACRTASE